MQSNVKPESFPTVSNAGVTVTDVMLAFRQQLCLTTAISLSVDISYLIRPLYCINNPACLNVGECSGSSSGVSIFVNTIRNSGLAMLYKQLTCR